jgi:hypothetical protein
MPHGSRFRYNTRFKSTENHENTIHHYLPSLWSSKRRTDA